MAMNIQGSITRERRKFSKGKKTKSKEINLDKEFKKNIKSFIKAKQKKKKKK